MSGADNQQERLALLGYLAGIVDGEGWIGITGKDRLLHPAISVHMVSIVGIENVADVAIRAGLPSYHHHMNDSSRFTLKGYKRCVPFLEAIRPYLFIKARQADLVFECHRERKKRPYHNSTPSVRELEIRNEIRALNTKGKNPQRLYVERREAKIESELHGDM